MVDRSMSVLVVDDQATSCIFIEQLVRNTDDQVGVTTFERACLALDWARDNPVDLVLTDLRMPEIDGIEFVRALRQLPDCNDVPVMVISAVEDREKRYEALESGATDFLSKPIDQREFRVRFRNLLTLRRQQRIIGARASLLEARVVKATDAIRLSERETLYRLARAGEYRDEETGAHVARMASYSRLVAHALGLSEEQCELIELAAPMHDIGKIGISDRILLKPGKLTAEEFEVVKQHTRIGHEILKDSPSRYLQLGAVIALRHHEWFDGSGYPDGLGGDDIPLDARIVAIADCYDALTSDRPYKKAWPHEEALEMISRDTGRHFDPQCAEAFLAHADRVREIRQALSQGGPGATSSSTTPES